MKRQRLFAIIFARTRKAVSPDFVTSVTPDSEPDKIIGDDEQAILTRHDQQLAIQRCRFWYLEHFIRQDELNPDHWRWLSNQPEFLLDIWRKTEAKRQRSDRVYFGLNAEKI